MARHQPGSGLREARASVAPLKLVPPATLPPPVLDLTVVVPYYNPGPALRSTVERAVEVLQETGISFEVVTVSDGSTDGSDASLEGMDPELVVQVVLPHAGKGKAVRAGLARGRGRYLGFIDGDGDVPPELLAEFVQVVHKTHPDVVLGSKRHPDSQVVYPVARRLYSWGYQQLVRVLFHLDVRDTQAGIKLVRRARHRRMLRPRCRSAPGAPDAVRARRSGLRRRQLRLGAWPRRRRRNGAGARWRRCRATWRTRRGATRCS